MHTIGIDFGTSYCTASWINPSTRKPEPIRFIDNGQEKMPSVVYYQNGKPVVGHLAYEMIEKLNHYPPDDRETILTNIVQGIKREMEPGAKIYISNDGASVTHEQIIADILIKIKSQAEQGCFANETVEGVVITHPVAFANWQKDMLKNAATLAGFKSINLMPEPIAAAMGYAGSGAKVGKGILIYDFGGGTFDVAFVQKDGDEYRIPVPPEGEQVCGGEDLDLALYQHFEKQIEQQHNRKVSDHPGRVDLCFKAQCRKHKESLSLVETHDFSDFLPPPNAIRFYEKTTRENFEKIISPIVDRTITKTESILKKVKEAGLIVDTVVLIGGSTRIPSVEKKLLKILPVAPLKTMYIDVAVALGALYKYEDSNKTKRICSNCKNEIEGDNKFCIHCGTKVNIAINKFCKNCKKHVDTTDKFCMHCGSSVFIETLNSTKVESAELKCNSCGFVLKNTDKFCISCGIKI